MPLDQLPDDINFDPQKILEALAQHNVEFIVVGGVAAIYHASPYATFDLDICPAGDDDNLRRLAAALTEMDARMRFTDEPEPIRIDFSPQILLAVPVLNLETRWGALDLIHSPAGANGFADLRRDAIEVELRGLKIAVASRSDILRSKEALYRDKDLPTIRLFRELEERELEEKAKSKKDPDH